MISKSSQLTDLIYNSTNYDEKILNSFGLLVLIKDG